MGHLIPSIIPLLKDIEKPNEPMKSLWRETVAKCIESDFDLYAVIRTVRSVDSSVDESDIRAYWNELRKPKIPKNTIIIR